MKELFSNGSVNPDGKFGGMSAAVRVLLVAGFALFVLVALAEPARAQQSLIVDKVVSVPESSSGVDTGVDVRASDRLVMSAGGEISPAFLYPSTDANGYDEANCAHSNFPAPCERKFSLIGRIGASPYFFVGTNYDRIWGGAQGRLFLRTNDDAPGGGSGSFSVRIRIFRDVTPPDTTITSGPSGVSNGSSVVFNFTSTESGAFECSMDFGQYSLCSSPKTYAGLAEGSHTFHVRARDGVGNVDATPASRAFSVDTVEPSGTVVISGAAAITGNASVSLTTSASDSPGSGVSAMRFSNDGVAWSEWEPYTANKSWTLGGGDGEKTVRAQFSDVAGNVATAQDSITLDTTAPTGTIKINNGASKTKSLNVRLNLSASDGSGVSRMCVSNAPTCSAWRPYSASLAWKLSGKKAGTKTVYVKFEDRAGNVSAVYRDTIKYAPKKRR